MINRLQKILFCALFCLGTTVHAQTWTNQSPMKLKRAEATAVNYENQLYVFNGFSNFLNIGSSIEKYDLQTRQWNYVGTTSEDNGTSVTHTGTVLVGNEVWLIGGRIGSHPGLVTDNVRIYNLDTNQWRFGPSLPTPMAGGGAALVDNKIYSFGGMDAQARCDVNFNYVYDLHNPSNGWQNLTQSVGMPSARNHFSTVVVNDLIYAIGGQHGHDGCPSKPGGNVKLVHAFDPTDNKWTRLADLPAAQSHNEPSTFVYNGFIYTVGGNKDGNKVLRYDPALNLWEHVVDLPQNLLAPAARIYDGELIVGGGGAPFTSGSHNVVWTISLASFNDKALDYGNTNATDETNDESDIATVTNINTDSGLVVAVEAESYTANVGTNMHEWVSATLPGASANASMVTTPNSGSMKSSALDSPYLSYNIDFAESGTYHLWIRAWGDEGSNGRGSSDSLHAGLNASIVSTADNIDGFPSGWNWSKRTRDDAPATINIPSAGIHTVNLWMREDGLAVDKFLLVKSESLIPSGSVQSESEGWETYSQVHTCMGLEATIVGTNASESILGTAGDDVIVGLNGNDVINGLGGDDTICGGDGNDTILAGSGNDWVDAGKGEDTVKGQLGNDIIYGGEGKDTLRGSKGNDFINGGEGDDNINGGWGDDALHGGAGNDTIDGFIGNDVLNGNDGNDSLDGGEGNDRIFGDAGNDFLKGGPDNDMLFGGAGDDTIRGSKGDDSLNGGLGNDYLHGGVQDSKDTCVVGLDDQIAAANCEITSTAMSSASIETQADDSVAWELLQTSNGSAVVERHEAGAVATNDKLYVMGGRGNRPVQSYERSGNKWTSYGTAPVRMHHFQPVAIGDKVYAIGALKDDNYPIEKPLEHVYIFDTSDNTWTKGAAIPAERLRGSVAAAVYNGKIYLVGGNTNGHSGLAVNWFDEFNPETNTWRVMPNAPNARDHATVAIANGKLVVAAGRHSQYPNVHGLPEAKTDIYDFTNDRWETFADDIPTVRAGTMTVAVGNEVIVIGGESADQLESHREVEALNVTTGKWRTLQPLLQGRHGGGAALLGDEIHVVTGNVTRGGGAETILHETLELVQHSGGSTL